MKAIQSPNHLYPGLYDSHCHLFLLAKKGVDIPVALKQYGSDGLTSLLNIVIEPEEETWNWHLDLARNSFAQPNWPKVALAAGIHPSDADGSSGTRLAPLSGATDLNYFATEILQPALELVAQRAAYPEVAAIGETGLDYHHSKEHKNLQRHSLEFHIGCAQQHHKVLIIHNRDSDEDLYDIFCTQPQRELPAGAIMHCFSGNPELIEPLLARDFYFSFAGNISYKNANALRHAVRQIPLERLLLETDAPFLAPQPVRGQINHPGFIGHTLDVLAGCHGLEPQTMLQHLSANWLRLFPIFA